MHFSVEATPKTLLFFTVLTSWTIGLGEPIGDKTLNLKIGFDLTQGTNGAPALRIRDFQDSDQSAEMHQRAEENKKEEEKVSPAAARAGSFSDEDEKLVKEVSSREENAQSSNGSDDDYGNDSSNRFRSTKGILPGEYEPEENAQVHDRQDDDDASDAEARRHRKRRDVDYQPTKRKSKKVRSARKQGVTVA